MKTYLMLPNSLYNTFEEKLIEDFVEVGLKTTVESHHFHQDHEECRLFDTLAECDAIAVRPYSDGKLDEMMNWCLKVMVILKKDLYLVDLNMTILKIAIVEKEKL